jgi:HAD superfamily hydrolase (TIGR01450 family)
MIPPNEIELYLNYLEQLSTDAQGLDKISKVISIKTLSKYYTNFMFDGFGTLFTKEGLLPGAKQTIDFLRAQSKKIRIVSNSASRSISELHQEISDFGLDIKPQEIITSGSLLTRVNQKIKIKDCFHFGKPELEPELKLKQIKLSDTPKDNIVLITSPIYSTVKRKEFMEKSASILKKENALLVCMNPDAMAPHPGEDRIEVTGLYAHNLQKETNCKVLYIGKPFPLIMESALYTLPKSPTIMIGDTLGTDIAGANQCGIASALVLSGNSSQGNPKKLTENFKIRPNYIINSLQF